MSKGKIDEEYSLKLTIKGLSEDSRRAVERIERGKPVYKIYRNKK